MSNNQPLPLRTAPLPLGTLCVDGADATTFLHAMLTQDILSLNAGEATRAGLCNAKGRLLADFLVTRRTEASRYHLTLHAALVEPIRDHLKRFILRQKVHINPSDEQHIGFLHPDDAVINTLALPQNTPLRGCASPAGYALWVHTGATPRALLFGKIPPESPLNDLSEISATAWDSAEILDGLPQITPQTSGQLVPQWINWDRLGAISFKKGCYPGQEVIARLHYLGKPNRQLVLGHLETRVTPIPGSPIDSLTHNETDAGILVRAAPDPLNPNHQVFLAVLRNSHINDELSIHQQRCVVTPIDTDSSGTGKPSAAH